MNKREPKQIPDDKLPLFERANKLERWSITWMSTIVLTTGLALSSSHAMKAAWLEDILGLVPPMVYLIASRIAPKPSDEEHPYGHGRSMSLAFLAASAAILVLGLYLAFESLSSLVSVDRPSLGLYSLAGHTWPIWSGWIMIAALVYSMVPPIILGRLKLEVATKIHSKTLYADAVMNKDDWLTAGAAVVGIILVGFGLWWADAAASLVISCNILRDGYLNIMRAARDLMDQRPTDLQEGEALGLEKRVERELESHPAVQRARVRLREEGSLFSGEAFLRLEGDSVASKELFTNLSNAAKSIDWRICEIIVAFDDSAD
ncbi:cation diffusion facilitator family transporter [Pelagicoccus sp. SDUM812002]|uniref:cation diffusion facilitator family transporter n=1 Tax=Pelagicoccus sp. SDUM812002 TaxID=3041266 RepID=UPI00280EA0E6|nr:cation diffusion facilitator family transporter [Pelagicoccus sp. SDUM812002]MDQ8184107.1 cation diffusion facilitator family transporter [Pelagicoccus sp. SDUM812002]